MADKPHYQTGAADRAHGTHGKGDSREELVSDSPVEPGNTGDVGNTPDSRPYQRGLEGQLGDAAWGNESAGGSVIDKRPPRDD